MLKISSVIKRLHEIEKKYGNIPLVGYDEEHNELFSFERIIVEETEIIGIAEGRHPVVIFDSWLECRNV